MLVQNASSSVGMLEELFLPTIGCCRLVYNLCPDQEKRSAAIRRRLTAFDRMKGLTSPKRELPFLKEPPNHPLQQAIHDLHRASRISLKAGPGSDLPHEGAERQFSLFGSQADQNQGDPEETSQRCNTCGIVDAASRINRSSFVRTNCGSIFDADVNVTKNILKPGISSTGGLPVMAC